jgi:FdhD protein
VELAKESGLTLAGFIRGDSMNVYSHPHRIEVVATPRAAEPTVAQRS